MKKRLTIKQVKLSGNKVTPLAPDGALCDNNGVFIVTPNNQYIIVNR